MTNDQTALLVMDVQPDILGSAAEFDTITPPLTERLSGAIDAARTAGVKVIYVVVGFREGYPEVSPDHPTFGRIAGSGKFIEGVDSVVDDAVAPRDGEVVVTKRRVSAFSGSDLDVVLRAGGIRHLVLTGIATSGVVLSTLRQAADLDFTLTVLQDGCLDRDAEVHRVLCEKVFPRQATVTTIGDWVAGLG